MLSFFKDIDINEPQRFSSEEVGNFLCVVGTWSQPFIYKMDMNKKEGHEIIAVKELADEGKFLELGNVYWEGQKCVVASRDENQYYAVDVFNETYENYALPDGIKNVLGFAKYEDSVFWMGNLGINLYETHGNEISVIIEHEVKEDAIGYAQIKVNNGKVYLFPNLEAPSELAVYDIYDGDLRYAEKKYRKIMRII